MRSRAAHAALALFVTALFIRMIIVQIWSIPRLIYIPIILVLLLSALCLERPRLKEFYVRFDRLRGDLPLGLALSILWYGAEWLHQGFTQGNFTAYRWDSLLLVPVGVLLAGWRAGVYEELMFRGLGMGYLNMLTRRPWVSIVFQAVVFCLAHVERYGVLGSFGSGLFSRLLWSILLGALVHYRRSVLPAVVIHSIGNSFGAATLPPMEMFEKALRSWWPS